jgi:hypothetical protein
VVLRLIIELEPGSTPIRGTTRREDDRQPRPFEGWIELAWRIEELHVGAGSPLPPVSRPEDLA